MLQLKSGFVKKALAVTGALGATSCVAAYHYSRESGDNEYSRRLKEARSLLDSSKRIMNLSITALSISLDYAYVMKFESLKSNSQTDYEKLAEELGGYQRDQELTTLKLWKTVDKSERRSLEDRIKHTRELINITSEKLANCDEDSFFSEVHLRSAVKLRKMCEENKGLYIKLGQHISMLDHIIPKIYQEELSKLLASNPHSSWESVQRVFREDIGDLPENIFLSFDRTPIASASLAQVHIAYGKGGKKYAVKIQHEGLRNGTTTDRQAITFLIDLLSKVFSKFNFNWLAREMNCNLPMELDFTNDLKNMNRCKKNLAQMIESGDVAIPEAFEELSSPRVLTMSFEEGCYVTDTESLAKMNIQPANIARTVSRMFCEQIFRHGFVHCDPHEANFVIRPNPRRPGHPQVVLLDHGLYRELDEDFRRNYCRLWQSIISSDEEGIKLYCKELNAGGMYTLLSAILTMRPWDDITSDDISRLKNKQSKSEGEMLKSYAHRYVSDIVGLMSMLPSDMLILLKTNDCLRHIDRKLGAPVNTATVTAAITADVILREDLQSSRNVSDTYQALAKYSRLEMKLYSLLFLEVLMHYGLDQYLLSWW